MPRVECGDLLVLEGGAHGSIRIPELRADLPPGIEALGQPGAKHASHRGTEHALLFVGLVSDLAPLPEGLCSAPIHEPAERGDLHMPLLGELYPRVPAHEEVAVSEASGCGLILHEHDRIVMPGHHGLAELQVYHVHDRVPEGAPVYQQPSPGSEGGASLGIDEIFHHRPLYLLAFLVLGQPVDPRAPGRSNFHIGQCPKYAQALLAFIFAALVFLQPRVPGAADTNVSELHRGATHLVHVVHIVDPARHHPAVDGHPHLTHALLQAGHGIRPGARKLTPLPKGLAGLNIAKLAEGRLEFAHVLLLVKGSTLPCRHRPGQFAIRNVLHGVQQAAFQLQRLVQREEVGSELQVGHLLRHLLHDIELVRTLHLALHDHPVPPPHEATLLLDQPTHHAPAHETRLLVFRVVRAAGVCDEVERALAPRMHVFPLGPGPGQVAVHHVRNHRAHPPLRLTRRFCVGKPRVEALGELLRHQTQHHAFCGLLRISHRLRQGLPSEQRLVQVAVLDAADQGNRMGSQPRHLLPLTEALAEGHVAQLSQGIRRARDVMSVRLRILVPALEGSRQLKGKHLGPRALSQVLSPFRPLVVLSDAIGQAVKDRLLLSEQKQRQAPAAPPELQLLRPESTEGRMDQILGAEGLRGHLPLVIGLGERLVGHRADGMLDRCDRLPVLLRIGLHGQPAAREVRFAHPEHRTAHFLEGVTRGKGILLPQAGCHPELSIEHPSDEGESVGPEGRIALPRAHANEEGAI